MKQSKITEFAQVIQPVVYAGIPAASMVAGLYFKDGTNGIAVFLIAVGASMMLAGIVAAITLSVHFASFLEKRNVTFSEFIRLSWHWGMKYRGKSQNRREVAKEKPEKMLRLCSFLLPAYCQERYLKPALEEMKEERIRANAEAETAVQRHFIEAQFYVKLSVTYLFTLLCLFRDGLAKVSPVLKWIFFGSAK